VVKPTAGNRPEGHFWLFLARDSIDIALVSGRDLLAEHHPLAA